jgi:hypothetical protein
MDTSSFVPAAEDDAPSSPAQRTGANDEEVTCPPPTNTHYSYTHEHPLLLHRPKMRRWV